MILILLMFTNIRSEVVSEEASLNSYIPIVVENTLFGIQEHVFQFKNDKIDL